MRRKVSTYQEFQVCQANILLKKNQGNKVLKKWLPSEVQPTIQLN